MLKRQANNVDYPKVKPKNFCDTNCNYWGLICPCIWLNVKMFLYDIE